VQKKLLLSGIVFLLSTAAFSATPQPLPYGINFSYAVIGQSPTGLHGYRGSFLYEPPSWVWNHVQVFIDTGYGHWWVSNATQYHTMSIYSIAPVLRYFFKDYTYFIPYIDLSIGPSYLTKSRLDDHNLGIHYAFQDQIGFGAAFGPARKFTVDISALHYSNGSMSRMNAGLNIPMMLNMSYRF
jgi:hypothetical protein